MTEQEKNIILNSLILNSTRPTGLRSFRIKR